MHLSLKLMTFSPSLFFIRKSFAWVGVTFVAIGWANILAAQTNDVQPSNVKVGPSTTYQTIEGFGVFSGYNKSWTQVMSPDLANTFVDDLGVTISRIQLSHTFEPKDLGPDDQDPSKFNGKDPSVYQYIQVAKTLHDKGVNKFLVTVWSPPVWMKNPGTHGHSQPWCSDGSAGGYLLPENYDKFANYLVQFLAFFKQEVGVDAYAISPQNELAFDEPYASCLYTPEQYAKLVAVIGKKFQDAKVTTKILFPEDIGDHQRVMSYINGVLNDSDASQYAGIVAIHAYDTDGVTPSSPSAKTWGDIYTAASSHKLPFWMTETSGYGIDMASALKMSQAMYVGLKFGHVNAWIFWEGSDTDGSPESLTYGDTGQPAPIKFYAAKQFFRYIRPGAVSVDITADDQDILPLAFQHNGDKTLTLVLINKGTTDKTIKLNVSGSGPTTYKSYRTSATEKCVDIGSVNSTDAIPLPSSSITTLQGKL
jgi:glucuronoarabinoxylan endo-1,4-beta-xylanase